MACDASPYSLGAVLSPKVEMELNNQFRSLRYLWHMRRIKYSRLEKEALAIVFTFTISPLFVQKKKILILSDHKLLQSSFKEKKGIASLASVKLQLWALALLAYDYEIQHKKGTDNCNADSLSRFFEQTYLKSRPKSPIPVKLFSYWTCWTNLYVLQQLKYVCGQIGIQLWQRFRKWFLELNS